MVFFPKNKLRRILFPKDKKDRVNPAHFGPIRLVTTHLDLVSVFQSANRVIPAHLVLANPLLLTPAHANRARRLVNHLDHPTFLSSLHPHPLPRPPVNLTKVKPQDSMEKKQY